MGAGPVQPPHPMLTIRGTNHARRSTKAQEARLNITRTLGSENDTGQTMAQCVQTGIRERREGQWVTLRLETSKPRAGNNRLDLLGPSTAAPKFATLIYTTFRIRGLTLPKRLNKGLWKLGQHKRPPSFATLILTNFPESGCSSRIKQRNWNAKHQHKDGPNCDPQFTQMFCIGLASSGLTKELKNENEGPLRDTDRSGEPGAAPGATPSGFMSHQLHRVADRAARLDSWRRNSFTAQATADKPDMSAETNAAVTTRT